MSGFAGPGANTSTVFPSLPNIVSLSLVAVNDVALASSPRYVASKSFCAGWHAIWVFASGPILMVAPVTTAGPLYALQPPKPATLSAAKLASAVMPAGTGVDVPETSYEDSFQFVPVIVPPVPPPLGADEQAAIRTPIAAIASSRTGTRR